MALEALYDAAGGESWANDANWKTAAPLGEWHGVRTDASGRVTGLFLSRNGLSGSIPGAVGNLTALKWLYLDENALTGPIPEALGSLANLERLILSYAWGVSGALPAGLRRSPLGRLEIGTRCAATRAASRRIRRTAT